MQFYTDLARQLLNKTTSNAKSYQQDKDNFYENEDSSHFYELTVNLFKSETAFYERNRANHLMLKATIESVP